MTTIAASWWRRATRQEEPEWIVWALIAILLVIGAGARALVLGRTQSVSNAGVAISYPAAWVNRAGGASDLLYVGEPLETAAFPAAVRVQRRPAASSVGSTGAAAPTLGDLALKWSNQQSHDLLGYRVFAIEPTTLKGAPAVKVDYAYVAEPALGGAGGLPVVARGEDILLRQGDAAIVVSFVANATAFEESQATWRNILNSFELK